MGEESFKRMRARNGRVEMRRDLLNTIRKGQLKFAGHVMRKGGLKKLVLEREIAGRPQGGRRRLNFMGGWRRLFNVEALCRTADRAGLREMVPNVSL